MLKRLVFISLLAACSSDDGTTPQGTGDTASSTLTEEGGVLELEGVTLSFPPGAAPAGTEISVTSTKGSAPDGITAQTVVYEFGPAGLQFERPVQIQIPYSGPTENTYVFWSNEDGSYSPLAATFTGTYAITTITHFSRGFVGTAASVPNETLRFTTDKLMLPTRVSVAVQMLRASSTFAILLGSIEGVSCVSSAPAVASAEAVLLAKYAAVAVSTLAEGSADITCTAAGKSATLAVTVSNSAQMLVPQKITLGIGSSQAVSYARFIQLFSSMCTCAVGESAIATATYANGVCNATGVAPGQTTLTLRCSVDGAVRLSITSDVEVTAAPAPTLQSISVAAMEVSPSTLQLTAMGGYSDGVSRPLVTGIAWSSADIQVATVSSTGLVTRVSPGETTVTATVGGISGSINVTVSESTAALYVTCRAAGDLGPLTCLPAGQGYAFECRALRNGTNATQAATWHVTGENFTLGEQIDTNGERYQRITVGGVGTAVVWVESDGLSSRQTGTLGDAWVAQGVESTLTGMPRIVLPDGPIAGTAGVRVQFVVNTQAAGCASIERDATRLVTWDPPIVDARGVASTDTPGAVTIGAQLAVGVSASTRIYFGVAGFAVTALHATLPLSGSTPVRGLLSFTDSTSEELANGETSFMLNDAAWMLNDARVKAPNVFDADGVTVTGTFHGLTANTTLSMHQDTPVALLLSSGDFCLTPGAEQSIFATADFTHDAYDLDVTPDAVWSSDAGAVTVSNGVVTAVSEGQATVRADFGGVFATVVVSVSLACP